MEMELAANSFPEEDGLEADDEIINFESESEKCGICMEIIVDRGVLDCCQDWFCFACIDNWASITNLCPLCENEFQLITCVPVYDTIGGYKVEEDSMATVEDWSIEGNSNTLSFPSYYIDENAVTCLDGDDCKIRSGSATLAEDSNLDTSIACDSCDIWYHAFCVGFDSEGTSDDTWLCPRCVDDEMRKKSDMVPFPSDCPTDAGSRCLLDTAFSGKLSVSVADTGDTAIVVSMVGGNQENLDAVKLEADLLQSSSSSLPHNSLVDYQLETTCFKKDLGETSNFDTVGDPSKQMFHESHGKVLLIDDSCKDRHLDERTETDASRNVVAITGIKRKRREYRNCVQSRAEDREVKAKIDTKDSAKKDRGDEKQKMPSKGLVNEFVLDKSRKPATTASEDDRLGYNLEKENVDSDILSIVRGTYRRSVKGLAHAHVADKERKHEAGLRVKKIMKRASEDKESSVLVQKLREEIREAVRNKSSATMGKNLFDPQLLAAFRAAVTGPVAEPVKNLSPSVVRIKKPMLQKGRIRENLTKKIYGTCNGRRRRAWNRDREVEFWRHRCMRVTKPEKIETLKSVLNLLRKADDVKTERKTNEEGTNPILSRLYLADTSIFPRKDDIKPLSTPDGDPEQNKENKSMEKASKPSAETKNKALVQIGIHKGTDGNSKGNLQKEAICKSDDRRSDKRKWALEVLARKTASAGKSLTNEKQDLVLLGGNYPLLAQLPADMMPALAPTHHNKIPFAVRQAQLCRLAEHFLRKANLPVIGRTAVSELAIADAINIEKEVANKSKSKLVYVNLCSQELLHRSENSLSTKSTEANPSLPPSVSAEELEESSKISTDPAIEEALKTAGLLSDSPPCSPTHKMEKLNGINDPLLKIMEDEPSNVLDIDSNPELDIYGDFEYNLEDEDYIGFSSVNLSQQQAEEAELKMKLVFSTLNLDGDGSNHAPEFKGPEVVKLREEPASSLKCHSDTDVGSSAVEDKTDRSCDPPASINTGNEEPSLAECEELYGPDKEPFSRKFLEETSKDLSNLVDAKVSAKSAASKSESGGKNLTMGNVGQNSCDRKHSPTHSQKRKGVQMKKEDSKLEQSVGSSSVHKKVEAYVKEHIRPLWKSGVVTAEQYRWAVARTTDKVMKYHSKEKNANFLIKEGEKVKKLAEQYVEASQQKEQH